MKINSSNASSQGKTNIPDDHPRAHSLRVRERMKDAVKQGLVHPTGLIAHGRGEAFDYLLGEATPPEAHRALAAAAVAIRNARHPVLSVNGNVAALAARACLELVRAWPALRVEVNLFHRTEERVERLVRLLEAERRALGLSGAILGREPDALIPGLASDRAKCSSEGIAKADVVVVPLEDGDRCEALVRMGKTVVTIDLNPLSRTARTAHITVVDELTRALPLLSALLAESPARRSAATSASKTVAAPAWDNDANLMAVKARMAARLTGKGTG